MHSTVESPHFFQMSVGMVQINEAMYLISIATFPINCLCTNVQHRKPTLRSHLLISVKFLKVSYNNVSRYREISSCITIYTIKRNMGLSIIMYTMAIITFATMITITGGIGCLVSITIKQNGDPSAAGAKRNMVGYRFNR